MDPRRDRAVVPAAGAPGPDPARRRARGDLARAPAPLAPRVRPGQRGGADLRARVRGGTRAPGRLLRPSRDRREPAAAAVGVLPRARLPAGGRARVGRRRRRCFIAPTSSGSRATRSARRSGPATARIRRAVSAAAAGAVSEPERDRTYLQARVTRPLAIATFERAQPAFARALQRPSARFAERYSRVGRRARSRRAGGDRGRCCPTRGRCRRRRSRATRPARSGSCSSGCCGDQAVEEPEQVVRIDALAPRQRHPPDLRALLRGVERQGPGAARCRRRGADARDRRGGVRPRAGPRRDRLSGDVGGRPRRADRGLRALARARARRSSSRGRCRWSRSRRGSASGGPGRSRATLSQDRADRDRAGDRDAARSTAGSTASTGTPQRRPASGSSTTRPAGVRDEKSGRAAGRKDAAAAAVCARRGQAARDRRPPAARRRTSTRRAEASFRRSTGSRTISPSATPTCSALLDAIVAGRAARRLHHRAVRRRVRVLHLQADLPSAPAAIRRRQAERDERLARLATTIRSVQ